MTPLDERRRIAAAGVEEASWEDGFARPRVFLLPIAAPSSLGLAGFASTTFVVASNLAGWWSTPTSGLVLAPFAAMFGGLAQFLAGMWAYRARDGIATLAHGTWGAYWLAYGILNILVATHVLTAPTPWYHDPELGFWFFALAITTAIAAVAALAGKCGAARGARHACSRLGHSGRWLHLRLPRLGASRRLGARRLGRI